MERKTNQICRKKAKWVPLQRNDQVQNFTEKYFKDYHNNQTLTDFDSEWGLSRFAGLANFYELSANDCSLAYERIHRLILKEQNKTTKISNLREEERFRPQDWAERLEH